MEYIQEAKEEPDGGGCVFCSIPKTEVDRVLVQGELAYVVLNKFPYNPGHLLVVPLRHIGDFEDVTFDENAELQSLMQRAVVAIRREAGPDGFNVGLNLGRTAGAGIPEHLHWHVVPRWNGDTNFMSVVGDTRVLPELLAETYRRLKPGFDG
jgi:ATP adenylyltransferase